MSKLTEAAIDAAHRRRKATADKEAARKMQEAQAAIERVGRSPLGEWFPDVRWAYRGTLSDKTILVVEVNTEAPLLGAKATDKGDQGPDVWEIGMYRRLNSTMLGSSYERVLKLKEAADLGEHLIANQVQPAEFPEPEPWKDGPHSRACGIGAHPHGPGCVMNCPTCHGKVPE